MNARTRPVHVWLNGQRDNVGDSLLRRGYLAALRTIGPVKPWVGTGARGYRTGLGLQPGEESPPHYRQWWWRALKGAVRGDSFALNAGEFNLSKSYAVQTSLLTPVLAVARARGGRVVWWGAGVPPQRKIGRAIFLPLVWLSTDIRWRDLESSRHLAPAPFLPDWGFAVDAPESVTGEAKESDRLPPAPTRRSLLTIVLRGDREAPSKAWVGEVVAAAQRLGLTPHIAVQVGRDHERAEQLSYAWGIEMTPFDHPDHARQEVQLRAIYSRSVAVLSDRLHALILAATEGAVPLAWCHTPVSKVKRHLVPLGFEWVVADEPIDALAALEPSQLDAWAGRTTELCAELRHRIADEVGRLASPAEGEALP